MYWDLGLPTSPKSRAGEGRAGIVSAKGALGMSQCRAGTDLPWQNISSRNNAAGAATRSYFSWDSDSPPLPRSPPAPRAALRDPPAAPPREMLQELQSPAGSAHGACQRKPKAVGEWVWLNRSDPTTLVPQGRLRAATAARDAHTARSRGFGAALRHSHVPRAQRGRRAFRAEPGAASQPRRRMVPVPRGPFPRHSPCSIPPSPL